MKIIKKLCIIFILSFLLGSAFAQNKYKTFGNSDIVEYRSKDGLPSTTFNNTVKTNDGYIWLSGPEGTFRFDGYEFAFIGKEYGIPEMQSIYYDSTKNVLYFASPDKFATFNGIEFKTYEASSGYKLNENQGQIISFVKGDSKGRIWVGSYTPFTDKRLNGSLLYYENGKFTLFDSSTFPLDNAKNFIETPFGDMIFTSYGKNTQNGDGAYIALYKNNRFTRIDNSFGFNYINAVIVDKYSSYIDWEGNTWIPFMGNLDYAGEKETKGTGVLMYDGDKFHTYPGLETVLNNDLSVGDVFCDNINKKVYVNLLPYTLATKKFFQSDKTIFKLKNNRWEPTNIIDQIFSVPGIDKSTLNFQYNFSRFLKQNNPPYLSLIFGIFGLALSSVDPTQFFMNTPNGWEKYDEYNGLPVLDLDNSTLTATAKGIGFLTPSNSILLRKEDGILDPDIQIPNLYADRNGLVWASYSYSQIPTYLVLNSIGVNVWDGNKIKTLTVDDGLKSNYTFNPYQDFNLNVWIPTDKGLTQVREIQNSDEEWVFRLKSLPSNKRADYNVTNICETRNNEIYTYQNYVRPKSGSITEAVFFLGKIDGEKVIEIESPFSKELQSMPYQLYSLRDDMQGRLWLQGEFAENFEKLSSAKSELKIYDGKEWLDPPIEWNVPEQQLHFVGELDNGAYYLTAGHFYNFNGEKFVDLSDSSDQNADFSILKGASVAGTLTEIQSGEYLYIRLRNRGLVIFDGINLNFYTPRNSIIPTDIHNPTVDYKGNLFFGSQSGSVRIRGEKVDLYYDDERITAGGSATSVMDMNGNLLKFYIGVGILVEKNISQKASLKITSISVNDIAYHYSFKDEFSSSENSILFNYAVLNFSNLVQTKYEHMLEGYDTEWSRESNLSFTEYQNLPAGKYNFRVRATIGSGDKTDEAGFAFVINPPFWKTWWAYALYLFGFVSLLGGVRKVELDRRREKENKKLLQLENDRKTKELEEARQLQLSMLPKELPELPNLDIAVYMKTATEVGGDYYDFNIDTDGTLTVAIGDATGHGMRAGTIVTSAKSLFNSYAANPDILFTFREMTRCIKQMQFQSLAMSMMMLKINNNKLLMSSAGMPPAYIYRQKNKIVEEYLIEGMPLGTMDNFPYELKELELFTGDTILLMSDGFPELNNQHNEMFGYRRARNSFEEVAEKDPEEIIAYLKNGGNRWSDNKEPDDDVTFVVIKVK
ncbi:MAG: SpoIIE family protein phosphatase [Ignavibacterium sp.]|nr:SpoIIE family protein phosphatase [Ignavibacterium sp.]